MKYQTVNKLSHLAKTGNKMTFLEAHKKGRWFYSEKPNGLWRREIYTKHKGEISIVPNGTSLVDLWEDIRQKDMKEFEIFGIIQTPENGALIVSYSTDKFYYRWISGLFVDEEGELLENS